MQVDLNQIRRYELKYTITEETAAAIRDYIKTFFSLDKYVPPQQNGYVVNNLYFDTSDLQFYYDTRHRKLTRYKLRARYYGDAAIDFIWPEIKYRSGGIVWKTRCRVPIEKWPDLFTAQKSENTSPIIKDRIDSFEELLHLYGAQPIIHVRYFREPYESDLEEYGRITFDRRLSYCMANGSISLARCSEEMLNYDDPITTGCSDSPVLLEIKVETLVPFWAVDIINRFGLVQRPFSKYCYGIENNFEYAALARNSIFNG
jgi:hypothetical protein